MPASASPDVTFPSTSVTDDSWLTGFRITPADFSTDAVAAPHGTCGAQITVFTAGDARSAKLVTWAGLPGGTAMASTLVAKSLAEPSMTPPETALAILASSAEAKTSAGAPAPSCETRSEEPANENTTRVPGCASSNREPSVVKVLVSEAAANTVTVPVTSFVRVPAVVPPAAGVVLQPASPAPTSATAAAARSARALTGSPPVPRP